MFTTPKLRIPFLLFATTTLAWSDAHIHETVLPYPDHLHGPRDNSACSAINFASFFDPPQPTGHLLDYIHEYGDELVRLCKERHVQLGSVGNCFPPKDLWCEFPTVAPTYVLTDYSAYGSTASSLWHAHSATQWL